MIEQEFNYLKSQSSEKEVDDKEVRKIAEKRVKLGLIINSIAEKNNISIDDSDLTKAVVNEASKYPGQEKQVVEFYKNNPTQMNSLKSPIFENKVIKLIAEKASVKEEKISSEELNLKIASIEKELARNK